MFDLWSQTAARTSLPREATFKPLLHFKAQHFTDNVSVITRGIHQKFGT